MAKGNETVTVVRPARVDKLSTAPAGEPPTFQLENCQLIPRATKEDGGGWVNIGGWEIWCFTEPSQPVLHTDRVVVRGKTLELEGEPARFDKRGRFKALKLTTVAVTSG